jgi:hypothetical protein
MGKSDCLANINEVYVHTKTARKVQLTICLRHMKERFGGLTVPKKGRACTQHEVLTDHLANMDGSNICRRQPRPWYTGAEDLLLNIDNTWRSNSWFWGIKSKPSLPKYPTCVVTMRLDLETCLQSAECRDVSTLRKLMPIGG